MQIFLSVILTLAAVIIIFLIASFLIFKSTFGKVKGIKKIEEDFYKNLEKNSNKKYAQKIKSGKEKILSLDYEEIGIMSYDEFPLSGKLYLADGAGDKTVLLCHGYKSCGEFDFSQLFFEYFDVLQLLVFLDSNVLFVILATRTGMERYTMKEHIISFTSHISAQ